MSESNVSFKMTHYNCLNQNVLQKCPNQKGLTQNFFSTYLKMSHLRYLIQNGSLKMSHSNIILKVSPHSKCLN